MPSKIKKIVKQKNEEDLSTNNVWNNKLFSEKHPN